MANEKSQEVSISQGKNQEMQVARPSRMLSPFEEMDRIFENFFPRAMRWGMPSMSDFGLPRENSLPRVDVVEKDDEIVVRAEVAGVDKKDIDISMTENTLTIKGKTNHELREERGNYACAEIIHGSFSRTIGLPSEVDVDQAKASFSNGILEVDMPKLAKSKRRTLAIS